MPPPWEDCERPRHSLFQHLLVQRELDSGNSGDGGNRDSSAIAPDTTAATAAKDGFDSYSGAGVKAGVDDNAAAVADHDASLPPRLGMVDIRVRACNPWAAQPSWERSALGYRWVWVRGEGVQLSPPVQ